MTNKIDKFDGNHGGPRCADPGCWNDEPVPPAGYAPCSPELLQSGVDCATAPRWSSHKWDGHSHWHPVPPAGGDVEELAPDAAKAMQAAHNSCPLQLSGMDRMAWIADHFQRWYVCSTKPSITDALQKRIKELVDIHGSLRSVSRHTGIDVGYLSRLDSGERDNPSVEVLSMLGVAVLDNGAHVTRLQAEVERLNGVHSEAGRLYLELAAKRDALQSELTKARELVVEGLKHIGYLSNTVLQCSQGDGLAAANERCALAYAALSFNQRAQILLSNQSAPADKGQGEPVAWMYKEYVWATGLGGYVWRDKIEREAPDLAASSIKDLTALYAAPPAPVAVPRLEMANVVRSHMEIAGCPVLTSNQCHALAMKLNACLDEAARLNPIKQ
jgi:hypothetical protein